VFDNRCHDRDFNLHVRPNRGFVNGLGVFNFAAGFNHFQRPDERFDRGAFVNMKAQ